MYNRKDDEQMKNKKINNAKNKQHEQMPGYPKNKPKNKIDPSEKKYHDWNDNKKPKDGGGSMSPKKPAPKKPMSPAAKKLKRTASRPK